MCPWNAPKLMALTTEAEYLPRDPTSTSRAHPHTDTGPSTAEPSLVELMRLTREEWDLWTRGSAIRRAGYARFKRNVAVAIGNWLASVDERPEEAVAVLRSAMEDEEELVRQHAEWGLTRSNW